MAAKSTRIPEPPAKPQVKTSVPEYYEAQAMAGQAVEGQDVDGQAVDGQAIDHSAIEEKIRHRAHELYLQRGGHHGAHEEDWLQAEKEIRGESSSRATRL